MEYKLAAETIRNNIEAVDFGNATCELVPTPLRITETEEILGQKLPKGYVWFLKNYGGGSIFGDEIYAIPRQYSPENMADIAVKTLSDRKKGLIEEYEISICSTDFGEQFLFDSSTHDLDGDYPVIRKTGDFRKEVAKNFPEFLIRLIKEEIS